MTELPIADAQDVRLGTIALLRMESGRQCRATWQQYGRITAWWPVSGQQRTKPIGLYDPVAFTVLAIGHSFDDETATGRAREGRRHVAD